MEQFYVDCVVRAILDRREPTIIEVDEIPEGFEPGRFVQVIGGDELARIRDVDRKTNEIALDRFPRG